jgi:uncharacterized protein (DUF1778 family)
MEEKKDRAVVVYFNKEELKQIDEGAEATLRSRSNFLAQAGLDKCKEVLKNDKHI